MREFLERDLVYAMKLEFVLSWLLNLQIVRSIFKPREQVYLKFFFQSKHALFARLSIYVFLSIIIHGLWELPILEQKGKMNKTNNIYKYKDLRRLYYTCQKNESLSELPLF